MAQHSEVCGTDQNASCLDVVTDDFPGGYCNVDPCSGLEGHLCPIQSSCVQLNGENGQCFKDCMSDSDCRSTEGYFCLDMTGDHPGNGTACSDPATSACWHSGASHKICTKKVIICPDGPGECPSLFPRCVLPDGGAFVPPSADAGLAPGPSVDAGASPSVRRGSRRAPHANVRHVTPARFNAIAGQRYGLPNCRSALFALAKLRL
jgi:hypothetical protein